MSELKRLLPGAIVLLALAGGAFLLLRGGGEKPPHYTVELDNAYGLTKGAEIRVAGVRVGGVTGTKVDKKTARALVGVEIQRREFGDLRADATCTVEPQSLIGEYLLECEPGKDPRRMRDGETIPVARTTGTIPPDLVLDVMRRPAREHLGLILAELGAGFASRGEDLDQVIRRAVPALRETDRVLKILGDKQRTLQVLARDANGVMTTLAGNRRDVSRFVREARDTTVVSARRRAELAESVRRLPGFLRELRPALGDLQTVADRQTPALRNLRGSSDDLTRLLDRLGPFARAARPAVDALGEASVAGTAAVKPARETVRKAGRVGELGKDPLTNLRFVLEHIDDRDNAVEPSPLSEGGKGFTGVEAFLRFPFEQTHALNIFDSRGYLLKLSLLVNECSGFTNAESAKRDPGRTKRCNAWLGPNQPGVTTPDPSPPQRAARSTPRAEDTDARLARRGVAQGTPDQPATGGGRASAVQGLADYLLAP